MGTPSSGYSYQIESLSVRSLVFRIVAMTLIFGFAAAAVVHAQTPLPLMPLPFKATAGTGEFIVNNGFGITFEGYQEPRLERAKLRFLTILSRQTGIPLWQEAQLNQPSFFIKTGGPSAPVQQLEEDESYHLQITPDQVPLEAANPLGILHGLQTFLQLVSVSPQGV